MTRTLKLKSHAAIRSWVKYRNGQPAMTTSWDDRGHPRPNLTLVFRGRPLPPPNNRYMGNIMPCSWTSWFAELDRQHLALEIADDDQDDIHESDIQYIDRNVVQ